MILKMKQTQRLDQLEVHPENLGQTVLQVGRLLKNQLGGSDLLRLMRELELPLIGVLVRMQERGIRIDRNKFHEFLQMVQAELDALIAAEDAEDVEQNAEIARLTAEVSGQNEAIGILESIKTGVSSDLNGDGGMVVPDPVEEEPVVEQPVEPVEGEEPAVPDAGDVVAEAPQTQTAEGEVVGDGTAVQQ